MNWEFVVIVYPILLFSIVIHEVAHGWMAEKFGDDTARAMGRLTLNPLPHMDIIGTVILPIMGLLYPTGFMFGWAKPVPVNPYRLNDSKKDMLWVGFAGPLSNMLLAFLSSVLMTLLILFKIIPDNPGNILIIFFKLVIQLNIVLFVFNLLPVPPLDGSRIVMSLLPYNLAYKYAQLEQYGFIIIIGLLVSGVLNYPLSLILAFFMGLMTGGLGLL